MKCCDITSGQLRHKITVERESIIKDSVGGFSSTWATHIEPFAKVVPISGRERYQAMKLEANVTHKIYIRYTGDIKPTDKIIFNGEEMQIRAILNLEYKDVWLELSCDQGQVN